MKKITYLKLKDINLLESNPSIEVKTKLLQKQESIIQILKGSNQFYEAYYNEKTGKYHYSDGCLMQTTHINRLLAEITHISNRMDGDYSPVYYNLN